MFAAQSMGLGYHGPEDRLVLFLTAKTEERQVLLTRRICLGLIGALGRLLEQSAGAGQDLPDEVREAVVFIEHQRSIFDPVSEDHEAEDHQGLAKQRHKLDPGATLVTTINIKSSPTEFVLLFQAGSEQIALFKFGRRDLHRFVGTLKAQAEKAGWDRPVAEGWLGLLGDDVTVD
jgi:hypothetical protein